MMVAQPYHPRPYRGQPSPYTEMGRERKFDLDTARRIVGDFADLIRPAFDRLEVCGSIRRGSPYVKDADLVVIPNGSLSQSHLHAWLDGMLERGLIEKALYGDSKTTRWGPKLRGLVFQGLQIEIDMADEHNWGYKKVLRSGPKSANEYIMGFISWRRPALRLQGGYGWYSPGNLWVKHKDTWQAADKVQLSIPDEETLFALLGMPYLPPNERSEMRYKMLMGGNRHHRWPDFSKFVRKMPAAMSMFGNEARGEQQPIQRDMPPAASYGLMSSTEFNQYRNEQRQQFINDNLDRLKDERAALWQKYCAARAAIDRETDRWRRKHLEENLYAEGGTAWQWARVDAAICAMGGS